MSEDITFVIKAKNEARKAAKQFSDDMKEAGVSVEEVKANAQQAAESTKALTGEASAANRAFTALSATIASLAPAIGAVGTALAASALNTFIPAALITRTVRFIGLVGLLVGALGGLALLGSIANNAREFNAALAETSTLIEGTPQQLADITQAATELVVAYGGDRAAQIQAFYQAISGGASDVAEATAILDTANKLAIGGVTDVTTGVSILTTAVNSYGSDVITAEEASDALFVAMRAGVTTVGELSNNLGQVIPVANALGVSFDEVAAAVSALTTQGITTNVATTQLRAILQGVIKPTAEAEKAAEALGIEFNAAALEAKGLEQFLFDVRDAAGGNIETISQLFTSVEALGGFLALTGGGAETFSKILLDMRDKAGVTDEAFQKVAKNLDQRFKRAVAETAVNIERLGQVVLRVVVPALEAFAAATTVFANNIDVILVALGLLAVRALPTAIGALRLFLAVLTGTTAATTRVQVAIAALGRALGIAAGSAGLLTRALNLLPFVAITTALVALNRNMNANAEANRVFIASTEAAATAHSNFVSILEAGSNRISQANREILQGAGEASVTALRDAITSAERELEAAEFTTNLFGVNLFETQRLREAQDALDTLNERLEETQQRVAVIAANDLLNKAFSLLKTGSATTATELGALARATQEVGSSSFTAVPPIEELRSKYGELAETVRQAIVQQNELAILNGAIEFNNTLSQVATLLDQVGLTTQEMFDFNQEVVRIKQLDSFGDQARAAADLANEIIESVGGVQNLEGELKKAVAQLLQSVGQAANLDANARNAAGAISSASGAAAGLSANLAGAAAQAAAVASNLITASNQAARIARASLNAAPDPVSQAGARDVAQFRESLDDGGYSLISSGRASELADQENAVRQAAEEAARAQQEAQNATQAFAQLQTQIASGGPTGASGSSGVGGGAVAQAVEQVSALDQAAQGLIEEYQMMEAQIGLTSDELEEFEIRQRLLQAAQQDGVALSEEVVASVLAQRDAYEQAVAAADTFANGVRAGFEDFKDSVQTNMEFAREFTTNAFNGLSDVIADFVKTGKLNFKDLLVDLLGQIASFLANRLLIDFLGVNGNFSGGTGGKGTMDLLGGLFGGFRAEGGPVMAGKSYVVGEDGPELFRPNSSGTIIPNGETSAAAGPTIIFQITTNDADSFKRSQGQIEARMAAALNRANERNN